jgi:DinB superfamily
VAASSRPIDVYVEVGPNRAFAGAVEWPGWSRSGKAEDAALETLADYAPRYAEVVGAAGLRPPARRASFKIVERVKGDATTDFGAPSAAPKADRRPVAAADLTRLLKCLDAVWAGLDRAVDRASDAPLARGPRGGGRTLEAIVRHVVDAEGGYVRHLAARPSSADDLSSAVSAMRDTVRDALTRAVLDGLPERGPRGGRIWTPRYFVRRTAWHALDHAWEIEDRSAL